MADIDVYDQRTRAQCKAAADQGAPANAPEGARLARPEDIDTGAPAAVAVAVRLPEDGDSPHPQGNYELELTTGMKHLALSPSIPVPQNPENQATPAEVASGLLPSDFGNEA